jgi:hypothetical protein
VDKYVAIGLRVQTGHMAKYGFNTFLIFEGKTTGKFKRKGKLNKTLI